MIIGIGSDLIDIRRVEKVMGRYEKRFIERCFTDVERAKAERRREAGTHIDTYAKRFAAKEAVAKALATEESGALSWHDVEIVNAVSGRPDVLLHGGAKERLRSILPEDHTAHIKISLSDERDFAVAFAVVEARPDC